jgi:hypothetical protein
VVVAGDCDVYQLPPGHRHRGAPAGFPGTERPYPTAPEAGRQGLCLSFWPVFWPVFRAFFPGLQRIGPAPRPASSDIGKLLPDEWKRADVDTANRPVQVGT